MKLLTWNCNLNLAKKFHILEPYNCDIFIIQECERLKTNFFPNYDYFWAGKNEKKGLGILVTKSLKARISHLNNQNLIYFLPLETELTNLLGVWAFNHRALKFGKDFSGYTSNALSFYKKWLVQSNKFILGGDLNNSVLWDKGDKQNNFLNIESFLRNLDYKSVYHSHFNEEYGCEKQPTFFHTKNENKSYHIDFLFLKSFNSKKVELGSYSEWIKFSDHMPLICEVE